MGFQRTVLATLVTLAFGANAIQATSYRVDSRDNCIDLGATCEGVASKVVSIQTYRSVPYRLVIDPSTPPVYFDSNGNEFEGIFVGGPVGESSSSPWTWWHKGLNRNDELVIPASDQHLNLRLFMTDYGNLGDNSGAFTVCMTPEAWGNLPDVPVDGLIGASAIVDAQTGKIYVFGGAASGIGPWFNTTWVIDPESAGTWQAIAPTAQGPAARFNQSAIYDPNPSGHPRMIVFGGQTVTEDKFNDTWALDLVTDQWTPLEVTGSVPPQSQYHRGVYDPTTGPHPRMVLYGGEELGTVPYALDLTTNQWSTLQVSGGPGPGIRDTGGAVFYHPEGGHPQYVWFGGGHDGSYHDDLWGLDLTTLVWTEWPNAGGPPGGRESVQMVIDPVRERLSIFGGWDGTTHRADAWSYDLNIQTWTRIACPAAGWPSGTGSYAGAYDVEHEAFIIVGGYGPGSVPHDPVPAKVLIADRDCPPPDPSTVEPGAPVARTRPAASVWPVPSSGPTTIQFALDQNAHVDVTIVDVSGRALRTIENGTRPAGVHTLCWDGRLENGDQAPRGTYFCRIRAGSARAVRKLVTVD